MSDFEQLINKVVSKVEELNNLGIQAKAIIVSFSKSNNSWQVNNKNIEYLSCFNNSKIISRKILSNNSSHTSKSILFYLRNGKISLLLKRYLDARFLGREYKMYNKLDLYMQTHNDFDLALFRYPLASFGLKKIVKKYGGKIIFEHNTFELEETGHYKYNSLQAFYTYSFEKYFAPKILQNVKAIISVTDEINEYEEKRVKTPLVKQTIGNGINVSKIKVRTPPAFDGKKVNILFLVSEMCYWHGFDRLLNSMIAYEGNVSFNVYVVGSLSTDYDELIQIIRKMGKHNIFVSGYVQNQTLDAYFNLCHIACSCLAVWRKGLKETSALKVRDYLARGIPFMMGEFDKDLDNEEIKPFVLNVGNTNELIEMELVINFCEFINKVSNHSLLINEYAKRTVDYSKKMKQLNLFLKSIDKSFLKI